MSHNIRGIVLFLAAVLAASTLHAAVSVEPTPAAGVVFKIESGGAPTAARFGIMIEPGGLAAQPSSRWRSRRRTWSSSWAPTWYALSTP
jgi:hypothetical protein